MTCQTCKCKSAAPPRARDWLTPVEAAELVGVGAGTVRKWCERGLLGSKCGPGRGRYRIRLDDLKRVAGEEWCRDGRG